VSPTHKPIIWLHGDIKTPPFSLKAKREAGYLLRELQRGRVLSMPESRPMPNVGRRCHELRIKDGDNDWWVLYRISPDAIFVMEVFAKQTRETPKAIIDACKRRLALYDSD
jgi:phage-related protein